MSTQRDVFIAELQKYAEKDPNVVFISVDFGAPALDSWREKLPGQFLSGGISEQHSINLAAGLAAEGKKPYVYFMASWAGRCMEQVRYSCAMAGNAITILGNGVGLGYAPAGPAHEPNDDIGYMRTILGIEIHTPANLEAARALATLTYEKPKLRYLRLERGFADEVKGDYASGIDLAKGFSVLRAPGKGAKKVALLSCGYMLGRTIQARAKLEESGHSVAVIDLFRIKPLDGAALAQALAGFDFAVTIEEQSLDAGFGSALAELICDRNLPLRLLRLGLPDRYLFENGTRAQILDANGLATADIVTKIAGFLK